MPKQQLARFVVDTKQIYRTRSSIDLMRSALVLRACSLPLLVRASLPMLRASEFVFGEYLTYYTLVRWTFFKHFCGGIDSNDLKGSVADLRKLSINPVLDYAAEAPIPVSRSSKIKPVVLNFDTLLKEPASAVYDSKTHESLDVNMGHIQHCIETSAANASGASPDAPTGIGFAAVKLTALFPPQLLARMSAVRLALRQTWAILFALRESREMSDMRYFRPPMYCTCVELSTMLQARFPKLTSDITEEILSYLDDDDDRMISYLDWMHFLTTPMLCLTKEDPGVLQTLMDELPHLSTHEKFLAHQGMRRLDQLLNTAQEKNVRVMIDAEQQYYQPAIDAIVHTQQCKYNQDKPLVYNTYQCYLKAGRDRIENDLWRSEKKGYCFGGKIVRGAYVSEEHKAAKEFKYSTPILPSEDATHDMYNGVVNVLFKYAAKHPNKPMGAFFATHNRESVERITRQATDLTVPHLELGFGQLYGMGDYLSVPLADADFRVYKYLPYGPIKETLAYLHRRALENSEVLSRQGGDYELIKSELRRRIKGG